MLYEWLGELGLIVVQSSSLRTLAAPVLQRELNDYDITSRLLHEAGLRLQQRGWISGEWGTSENNRKAKFYELTRTGRTKLAAQTSDWARLTRAVGFVLDMG